MSALRLASAVVVLLAVMLRALEFLGVFPSKTATSSTPHTTAVVAHPVVTDLTHRIEKELYLYTSQQSAWLYVALVNEEELAAEDLLVMDIRELIIVRQDDATAAQGQRLHLKSALDPGSEYAPIVGYLWLSIREDPLRVRFPIYNSSSGCTATKDWSKISKKRDLWTGVYEVLVEEKSYVYKEVDKPPNYEVRNSEVLEQELRTLELLRGTRCRCHLRKSISNREDYQRRLSEDPLALKSDQVLGEYLAQKFGFTLAQVVHRRVDLAESRC